MYSDINLDAMLKKPWTSDGKTFTDRCWEGKADLIDGIQKELTQSLLRGDSLAKTRDHIAERFEVSKYKAGRLAHTEATYFNAVSSNECYKDLGVDQIEILETLDKHTCELCAAMDGKVIDQKDYQPGVTVPPFHPNCRGTTMPWFDDMADVGQRIARDNEGEVYYVPPDMTYKEWEKTFVEGGSKGGQKRMLLTTDDPIREILGSAFDSHPEEVEKIIGEMNVLGVSVEYRKGAMGYEPYPVPGMPGKIVMDPEASYSAWLHERTHVKDDENSGWKGFRNFADPEVAAKFEENAYDVEIAFAEKMGYNDIVEKLKALKEKRIREVLGIENG